jgi:putative chitinase
MVNSQQLIKLKNDPKWVDPLNETFARFNISNINQQAAFIAQCGHESKNFTDLEEGLSYSAPRLVAVFPKRFPTIESALPYSKNPKALANKIYANRMGNRDEASGDGYRFRGRGCLQTTGHANYYHAGQALGVDFVMEPDLVASPKYAALTAGFFWSTHGLNELADKQDHKSITKRINGGYIGLADREEHTRMALAVLTV